MWKVTTLFVRIIIMLAVGLLGLELARQAYFYPTIPAADYPPPANREEAWQQDLDYLQTYVALNRPYTDETRAEALALINTHTTNIDNLSDAELKLGIARVVAISQNGHSFARISDLTRSEGRIPLMGRMFDDGYTFLWAQRPYRHLLGAQLLAIDGHPIEEVIDAFRPYSGAKDSFFRQYVGWYLETPSLVHAVGYAENPRRYTLRVRPFGSQELIEIAVSVSDTPPPVVSAQEILTPMEMDGWEGVWSQRPLLPFFLQDWEAPFQAQAIDAINGYYIRYGANDDVGEHSITAFNKTVAAELAQHNYAVLIIDQRGNGGGDYTRTYDLMRRLPELAGEQTPIYVITGPLTFSAGISSVAFLKASGGEQVTIIGTEMGDHERMWGETSLLTLPNSQLDLQLATGLHDYKNGCHQFPECYWLDFFMNVSAASLSPDITIPFTFEAYVMGQDAAMNHILEAHSSDSAR
ncbi:MAG: hypothetical protein CL608_07515 [Anaerolineaceae bacterium]|nr:hypothetical protein [Anaerolineaceae bacterium]